MWEINPEYVFSLDKVDTVDGLLVDWVIGADGLLP